MPPHVYGILRNVTRSGQHQLHKSLLMLLVNGIKPVNHFSGLACIKHLFVVKSSVHFLVPLVSVDAVNSLSYSPLLPFPCPSPLTGKRQALAGLWSSTSAPPTDRYPAAMNEPPPECNDFGGTPRLNTGSASALALVRFTRTQVSIISFG